MSGSFKVKLPESVTAEKEITQGAEVYMTSANEVYVNNTKVSLNELPVFIKVEFGKKNNKDVIVKADKDVKHGEFIKLLDVLKTSGAQKLLISTKKVDNASNKM
jgi:biopolymer transport protein ExbD